MTEKEAVQSWQTRWIHRGVWSVLIAASVLVLLHKPDQNFLIDFGANWSAARLLWAGENPFDAAALLANQRAAGWDISVSVVPWNPPWTLAMMVPFALLPFKYAQWFWLALNCLLVIFVSDFWWKTFGGSREHRMASWLAAIWYFPCVVAVYFGQMSLIVLAGITGIAWSLRRGRPEWLGIFVFLASVKPHLLLPMWMFLLFWLVRGRHWKVLAWAGSGIAVAGFSVMLLRPNVYLDYVSAAGSTNSPVIWATPTIGTVLRVAFAGMPKWIAFVPSLCGLLLSLALWWKWKNDFDWERRLEMILLLSLVSASYAWIFDWVLLLPVVLRVLVWFQSNPAVQYPALLGLIAVMTAFVWVQARGWFPLGVVWFPGGLAAVFGWARWRQDRLGVPT